MGANVKSLYSSLLLHPLKLSIMEKGTTCNNSPYTMWLIELLEIICTESNLTLSEIALTDAEVRGYYDNGNTPTMVFFHIWQGDAGNYYAI